MGEFLFIDTDPLGDGRDSAIPNQPDGIDEYSTDLPDPVRAAERIREYICANGDGVYDVIEGAPLYARDLEAVCSAALAQPETPAVVTVQVPGVSL